MDPRIVLDRLPPHSPEAEAGAISCLIQWPEDSAAMLAEQLTGPEAFYDLRNQAIYTAICGMVGAGMQVDFVTICHRIRDTCGLAAVGDHERLIMLSDLAISSHQLSGYIEIIQDQQTRRRLLAAAAGVVSAVYEGSGVPVADVVAQLEDGILSCDARPQPTDYGADEVVDEFIGMCETGVAPRRIATGIHGIDEVYRPCPGDLYVIAARPSVGKTSLALSMICRMFAREGPPSVGLISLETRRQTIVHKMISQIAGIAYNTVSDPTTHDTLRAPDLQRLSHSAAMLRGMPLVVSDRSGLSVDQIISKARRWKRRRGLDVLFIDYLQLIRLRDRSNRYEGVTEISNALKALAMELDIVIYALAQINREVGEPTERPRMHHLRDSGSIEQDADVICLLQRHTLPDGRPGVFAHLDKVRNAEPKAGIWLQFDGPTSCIHDDLGEP